MTPNIVSHCALPAVAAFAALAAGSPALADPTPMVCRPLEQYTVEVDRVFPHDARYFECSKPGERYHENLVDIPSWDKCFLMDKDGAYVLSVPRSNVTPGKTEGTLRVVTPYGAGLRLPPYPKPEVFRQFTIDQIEVRIHDVTDDLRETRSRVECRLRPDYKVQVNDTARPDARLFWCSNPEASRKKVMVDVPSLDKCYLIDESNGSVVPILRSSIGPEAGGMVRVDRDGVGTKPTRYADMGRYRQFTLDGTEVRIGYEPALASAAPASDFPEFTAPTGVTAAAGQDVAGEESTTTGRSAPEAGTVAPAQTAVGQSVTAAPIGAAAAVGVAAPVADNPEAKQCLALEARPEPFGVAGCLKYVYLRNSCSRPVVVEVHKTQHLSSGALSERVTIVATAGGEQRFACAWSRGATAPSEFILLNAEFLTTATHAGIGAEHGPAPGR